MNRPSMYPILCLAYLGTWIFAISQPSTQAQAHESRDYASQCKTITTSALALPKEINRWHIEENIGPSSAMVYIAFSEQGRIPSRYKASCLFSSNPDELMYLFLENAEGAVKIIPGSELNSSGSTLVTPEAD
jgi:hypothetical protein